MLKILKLPQGIVGLCFFLYGFYALSSYNPSNYKKEDTLYAKNQTEYTEMYYRNQQKESEKDKAQIVIFVCLGLGLLQLGNAVWVAKRGQSKLDDAASEVLGILKSDKISDVLGDFDIDLD